MPFDTLSHQVAWSLLIGAEIFTIAALWPLSEWATTVWRHRALATAAIVVVACFALNWKAFVFARLFSDPAQADHVLAWLAVPLFLAFPCAVCVVSGQSLRHAGVPARSARVVALTLAGLTALVTPMAVISAACLGGMCL